MYANDTVNKDVSCLGFFLLIFSWI